MEEADANPSTRGTSFAAGSAMVRGTRSDSTVKVWPGTPYPLGATYDGAGTNVSVFSEIAARVELCLFDDDGKQTCVDLPEMKGFIWHGYVPNIGPGQRYGFRVDGAWDPGAGSVCHPLQLAGGSACNSVDG